MTTPTNHDSYRTLERLLKAVGEDVRQVRQIVGDMYDRVHELADTTDAVYRTVSYQPDGTTRTASEEWGFLEEDE